MIIGILILAASFIWMEIAERRIQEWEKKMNEWRERMSKEQLSFSMMWTKSRPEIVIKELKITARSKSN
ncbi:hypothetical protein PO124_33275 [Bacillus licheniformis]|nr:hypothetical protein [Bacillus licheniformis]